MMKEESSNKLTKLRKKSNSEIRANDKVQSDKKKSILKRRRLFAACTLHRVDLKHIVNINDIWYINEETLKDSQNSSQNIQRAMFRYNMISKIVLNSQFVGLQLKKIDDNYLSPEYFFQRFRSFGDQQIATIANDLQFFYRSVNQLKEKYEVQVTQEKQNDESVSALNSFLSKMQGKMYVIYFVQYSKKSITLKNLFFSVCLLQKLGWNIKRVACDFLKYRHVFFEIFSPKYYKDYIRICLQNYLHSQELEKDTTLTRQQKVQLATVYFDDEVIREVETEHGIYDEFLKAKVKFSCPHSSFCCIEIIDINENPTERIFKKRKMNDDLIEVSAEQQIEQLKNLGFQSNFLQLDQLSKHQYLQEKPS